MISIREFFGMILPGIAWALILYPFYSSKVASNINLAFVSQNNIILYVVLSFLVYLIGFIAIQISFKALVIIGNIVDVLVYYLCKISWIKCIFEFLMDNLHIFNTNLLNNEIKKFSSKIVDLHNSKLPYFTKTSETKNFDDILAFTKLYILEHSSTLGKEALKVEGEINFTAGIVFPLLITGFFAYAHHFIYSGVFLVLISFYLALRFQHLRHDENRFIFLSFQSLNQMTNQGRESQNDFGGT